MKLKFLSEPMIAFTLIVILFILMNPTGIFMPESLSMWLVLGFVVLFIIFASLIWKENATDERDHMHILHAGRISFLVGTTLLVTGIVFQSFNHEIDPWLMYALIGMVVSKIISRIYSSLKQ